MNFAPASLIKRLIVGIGLMFRRPRQRQIAALVWRPCEAGEVEVLLITTRKSKRWSVPRGWPIDGLTSPETAAQEAWEEAGVRGEIETKPLGEFTYLKSMKSNGPTKRLSAMIYALRLSDLKDDYPEAGQRERKWCSPREAAELVREPELCDILRRFVG